MKRLALFLIILLLVVGGPAVAGPLDGAFVYVGGSTGFDIEFQDLARIPKFVAELDSLGIKNLTVVWTAVKPEYTVCGDRKFTAVGGNWDNLLARLQVLLDEAHKYPGMNVKLGLTESLIQCPNFTSEENTAQVVEWNSYLVWLFESRWRFHPALSGYYIPDEPSLAASSFIGYTRRQVDAIRAYSVKSIVIAPYLGNAGVYGYQPSTVGDMALEFVTRTGVSKLLYQDSAGGTMNLGRNPNQPTLESYLTAIRDSIGIARLESDLELFNGGTYSSAAVARVNFQAWEARRNPPAGIAPVTSGITSWIPQSFMSLSAENSTTFPEAKRLYTEYRALYGIAGSTVPFTYLFNPPTADLPSIKLPSKFYPDRGSLNDSVVGDELNFLDRQWVGVLGTPHLTLDLGSLKAVDYVSAHMMAFKAAGIQLPTGICLRFSDGSHWGHWKCHATPEIRKSHDGEYVVSNLDPLHETARYVDILLPNLSWNFMSELTVVAGPR